MAGPCSAKLLVVVAASCCLAPGALASKLVRHVITGLSTASEHAESGDELRELNQGAREDKQGIQEASLARSSVSRGHQERSLNEQRLSKEEDFQAGADDAATAWHADMVATYRGRRGNVITSPNPKNEVQVRYDDGSKSEYIDVSELKAEAEAWSEGMVATYRGKRGMLITSPNTNHEVRLWYDDGSKSEYIDVAELKATSWSAGMVATHNGKTGTLIGGPNHNNAVKLWYLDGSESEYINVAELKDEMPPACVRDAPDSAYFSQEFALGEDHNSCSDYGICGQTLTNGQRVESIRGVARKTKAVFEDVGVARWTLSWGSALGAERCGDVLPWDDDCDVMLSQEDLRRLNKKHFNTTDYAYKARSKTLDDRYELRAKSHCIPLAVVDTKTGYYCDVFVSEAVNDASGQTRVETRWPYSSNVVGSDDHPCSPKGYSWPFESVYPATECTFAGETFPCARHQESYLTGFYGQNWRVPDKPVSR